MIVVGALMVDDGGARVRLVDGWLRVEGTRIAEVHAGPCPHAADLGGEGALITPGFVDAHVHLPQFDSIGVDGLALLDWLERAVFPAEVKWEDADYAGHMAARVARTLLAHGTTSIAAYATVHAEGARRAMRACADAGLGGWVGQVLMDQRAPAELCRPAGDLLREAESHFAVGRIRPSLTPRFAVSCSRALLEGVGELAERRAGLIQTHLSETRDECELVKRLHGVERYLDAYARAGLLQRPSLFAHAIHLEPAEIASIARVGAGIAHCPTANLFLQAGTLARGALDAAGVRVALGSDVAGGPDISMPRVARAMLEAVKIRALSAGAPSNSLPAAASAWHQITAGNAAILDLRHTGRLEAGMDADLLVVRPDVRWREAENPLGALLYAWDERWLTHTVAAGRVVFAN